MTLDDIQSRGQSRPPRVLAALVFLIGISLAAGGIWLAALGGSLYYALAGGAMVVSAALLWRGRRTGALIYGIMFLATFIWAFDEVGIDGWALLPRLGLLAVLGLWMLTPWVRRGLV